MKLVAFIIGVALLLLANGPVRAATDSDAAMTVKARFLLSQLQDRISRMQTTSLIDFTDFKRSRIYGKSLDQGWDTYYRSGNPHFHSRFGYGLDIMPQSDSIAIMPGDSLYLGLTIAAPNGYVASDTSIDLAPYMPGCRLYIYYRENLFGQSYLTENRPTPIEMGIYRIIAVEMAQVGVRIGKVRG
jgi:hypothetical protein